jgi:DNA-binding transcriptional regulator YdaS (Cro superfamily)
LFDFVTVSGIFTGRNRKSEIILKIGIAIGEIVVYSRRMDTNQVRHLVRLCGGPVALSRLCGITPQAISQWRRVPPQYVNTVTKLSGWPQHKIRPDIFAKPRRGAA